ncbi:glycosyltransferase [Streptomyces sp. NPDC057702]|uniref:glycosyltransferase n=1 Tax=unclassified Streptomyces TaxID=2593676 RepID=UPI0036BEDB32
MNVPDGGGNTIRCTVAILCYNQADIIAETVRSALSQTRSADEILVVDDGSTDESVAVLSAFEGITVIRHEGNRGRTATRNTLLESATGDVVVYLDGDTVARPDFLAQLLPEYADPAVAAVGGQGVETRCESVYDRWRVTYATQSWGPDRRVDVPWLYGLACSFRREVLETIGGFYGYAEDLQVGYAIRAAGFRLTYVPGAVVEHRRQDDRASFEHMLYRWWRGSFLVEKRWGKPALRHLGGELVVDHARHVAQHAVRRDWPMVSTDLRAALAKVRGMRKGYSLWQVEKKTKGPHGQRRRDIQPSRPH